MQNKTIQPLTAILSLLIHHLNLAQAASTVMSVICHVMPGKIKDLKLMKLHISQDKDSESLLRPKHEPPENQDVDLPLL
jgi:hypothetical protein